MVMVVGDIIGFSTIAETTGDRALLENIDRLYAGLRQILARHHGTLSNYVGDAFFATWEAAVPDNATVDMATFDRAVRDRAARDRAAAGGDAVDPARSAVAFAVEAAETVRRIAACMACAPRGGPLRMGWASPRARGGEPADRDARHRARRRHQRGLPQLSRPGLAGDGLRGRLVTDAVYGATSAAFAFTSPSAIQVKGRRQPVQVLGVGRR